MPVAFLRCFSLITFFAVWVQPAEAMSFKRISVPGEPGKTMIYASGPVEAGDADRFVATIAATPPSSKVLGITSPGGGVIAALELADKIDAFGFSVVGIGDCASACAQILFPAGEYSTLSPGSLLGIHSCSAAGARHEICNEEIAQIAVERGFPYGTLDMYSDLYGPSEMKWMGEIGARCFGFYRGPGDPKPIFGQKACVDGVIYTMGSNVRPRPFGPSFDCAKAATSVEQLLCADKELMLSDSILGRVYDAARKANPASKQRIRAEQRLWIEERNAQCGRLIPSQADYRASRAGALCLHRFNEERIYALIQEGTS
ncbi:lysozyme inhibitor LprI family protein [Leisingera caerulea]|uniref:lysozyme inhibitor LprI family protein n=1 Tax=Leisingera caerulea TaxID=506591 RepID=UPI000A0691E2|nr:lysozyme inhibitor LprI family protein [Leisingera caerulea]